MNQIQIFKPKSYIFKIVKASIFRCKLTLRNKII
jgi:hypothetical protein